MKRFSWLLILLTLFFMVGCEKYRCEINKEINPEINVVGSGVDAYVILEYDLTPSIHVVDALENLESVDIYYFSGKNGKAENINLFIKQGQINLKSDGCYYNFEGTEYKGSKCPSLKTLINNRTDIPEFRWTLYDGDRYDGILDSELQAKHDDLQKEGDTPKKSPDKPEEKKEMNKL